MAQSSPIEWTGWTVNPIRGRNRETGQLCHWCLKISPGCANCYASAEQRRWGGFPFEARFADQVEVWFDQAQLQKVLRRRKPTTWFWCSMTDMFGEWVPDEWIAACFGVMAATPWHTHQVLTKRAARLPRWASWVERRGEQGKAVFPHDDQSWRIGQMLAVELGKHGLNGYQPGTRANGYRDFDPRRQPWPLPNVQLMVSAEDQPRANERIPHLLRTPAAVRGVSCEPLLGPIDLTEIGPGGVQWDALTGEYLSALERSHTPHLDWVIVGGESGSGARPMLLEWVRPLRDQCELAGVPMFFKQWGEYTPYYEGFDRERRSIVTKEIPNGVTRVGKRKAGRLLDGRTWDELPGAVA